MTRTTLDSSPAPLVDWMGFPAPYAPPIRHTFACNAKPAALPSITSLVDPFGRAIAASPTELWLWRDDTSLHVRARCVTAAADRIRKMADRAQAYNRDDWGHDALELQIDAGLTREAYFHIIIPPNKQTTTYFGFNNRQTQGWHPPLNITSRVDDDAWHLDVTIPFAALGATPIEGDVWGFNVMRVNADESNQYVQWAPTFGDALRPELFGQLHFAQLESSDTFTPAQQHAEVQALAAHADARSQTFLQTINAVTADDALQQLGMTSWPDWASHIAARDQLKPLRWGGYLPGPEGIPSDESPTVVEEANTLVATINAWTVDPPAQAAFDVGKLEILGDAWLLTGDAQYVAAFDRAMSIHGRLLDSITASITDPLELPYQTNPYHDSQTVSTAIVSYAYLTLAKAGLSPHTHAVMMQRVLRASRFSSYNIRTAYHYGNHQVYESSGLATIAALFPEFPECDDWAAVASRAIRIHLDRELYDDGAYMERCAYHSVALGDAMHAVSTIRVNHIESRFVDLMHDDTQQNLTRMHDWMLMMVAPDGTLPAFGDCGTASHLAFLQRGAWCYQRGDYAWPLQLHAPDMIPQGVQPTQPTFTSATLPSQFTVMRDGWNRESFYLAADHGPMGGQHSHIDTVGFVAYAHGGLVAMDSGIGLTYEDPRYVTWFRALSAHNVIQIADAEPEKVAALRSFHEGDDVEIVSMRSEAWLKALGVVHDRDIYFCKGAGWLIHDRLEGPAAAHLGERQVDWLLHTPHPLAPASQTSNTSQPTSPARLDAFGSQAGWQSNADTGLAMFVCDPTSIDQPTITQTPSAIPIPEAKKMRLWDASRRLGKKYVCDVTQVSLRKRAFAGDVCEFAVFLLPIAGAAAREDVASIPTLASTSAGWSLLRGDGSSWLDIARRRD